jgi:hypothetical protein
MPSLTTDSHISRLLASDSRQQAKVHGGVERYQPVVAVRANWWQRVSLPQQRNENTVTGVGAAPSAR